MKTLKTRQVTHRAVVAALLGFSGLCLAANAFAQGAAPAASPSMAALPANNGLAPVPPVVAVGEGDNVVVATVNDEPITKHDLDERLALFLVQVASNRPTDEDKARYRRDILKTLEREMIRLQEARRKSITVSPKEIEERITELAQANSATPEQMAEGLARMGANLDTLRNQIKVEIAWRNAVQDEFRERVITSMSEADVDAELARIAESANKPRYRVFEIFLGVDDPKDDARVQKSARDIYDQIKQGAIFGGVARQFSQNPSAASQGDIGWVMDGQLPEELNQAIRTMKKGELSEPIKSRGGYYLLLLADRMEPQGTKVEIPPTAAEAKVKQLPLVRILLPLGEKPSKEMTESGVKVGNDIRAAAPPCGTALQTQIENMRSVYMDLGMFDLADLSPELQAALGKTRPGETAEPVVSPAGVEIMVRCDAKFEVATAFEMPSREQVQYQIFENRITAMARGYERDLRRKADVQEH